MVMSQLHITNKFQNDQYVDIKERIISLEKLISDPLSDCYIERLIDVIVSCVDENKQSVKTVRNDNLSSFLNRFVTVAECLKSNIRKPGDFTFIGLLGHGAFGRVQLVREITTGQVCAMKILKKSRMLTQQTDYWVEREIMSHSESPWIVKLHYAFQNFTSLYMVMEFVPGGNLVSWMDEIEFMSEAACRFYAAEVILSLSDLHAMGFIHRDLKPDNLLLDSGGHLKLADFGTAVRVNPETLMIHCDAAVGTPDYLSPEVLLSQGIGGGSYGFEVDWWALGVVIYEMLYGVTPFYSETLVNTYANIMNHTNSLSFPDTVNVSDTCLDFMKSLLCDRTQRLGGSVQTEASVFKHLWFSSSWIESQKQTDGLVDSTDQSIANWSWSNIRACRAPFQPYLRSETDISYFHLDTEDEEDDECEKLHLKSKNEPEEVLNNLNNDDRRQFTSNVDTSTLDFPGCQLAFAGFSFSSSHPHRLALLNGLYLAPQTTSEKDEHTCISNHVDNTKDGCICAESNLPTPISTVGDPTVTVTSSSMSNTVTTITNQELSDSAEKYNNLHVKISCLQKQLDDALNLTDIHSNEIHELTNQLEVANSRCRELDMKCAQVELKYKVSNEETEQRLENLRIESAANCCRLEAEVAKWKSLAQSEKTARQSAETAENIAVATATDELARRAAELADRLGRSGNRGGLPTSQLVEDNAMLGSRSFESNLMLSDQTDFDVTLDTSSTNPVSQTDLLLGRVAEMAKRAHRAEALAHETKDQLEAEQHFSRLYKEACAEQSDLLKEQSQELAQLRELYKKSCKTIQRAKEDYEAARRALNEEQQKSNRIRDSARITQDHASAATQRAAQTSREVAQLRVELEHMTQAFRKEQTNCAAAVNKLTEVLTGKNADTLELMWLSSFQQQNDSNQPDSSGSSNRMGTSSPFFIGSNASRNKVNSLKGLGQQKRLNLQLTQRMRENKRLVSEINRLNDEVANLRKENKSKVHEFELRAISAENEQLKLREQLKQLTDSLSQTKCSSPFLDTIDDDQHDVTLRKYIGPQRTTSLSSSSASMRQSTSFRKVLSERENKVMTLDMKKLNNSNDFSCSTPSSEELISDRDFNVNFCGLLQVGPKRGKRNKLQWETRLAQLTNTHLLLWEAHSDFIKRLKEFQRKNCDISKCIANHLQLRNESGHHHNAPTLKFQLSYGAIYHVRSVNSCDLFHERAEDLPRIFQVIYDRQYLNANTAMTSDLSSSKFMKSSTSIGSTAIHAVHNDSAHATSSTLPRKRSFGSSYLFSTLSPQQHSNSTTFRRIARTDSTVGSQSSQTNRSQLLGNLVNQIENLSNNSTDSNTLFIKGHTLQRIQFRSSATCDLCQTSCWNVFHPPLAYQCTDCQFKLHASHLSHPPVSLPQCAKAVGVCLFRVFNELEKTEWMIHLTRAMKCTKVTNSSLPRNTCGQSHSKCTDGQSLSQNSSVEAISSQIGKMTFNECSSPLFSRDNITRPIDGAVPPSTIYNQLPSNDTFEATGSHLRSISSISAQEYLIPTNAKSFGVVTDPLLSPTKQSDSLQHPNASTSSSSQMSRSYTAGQQLHLKSNKKDCKEQIEADKNLTVATYTNTGPCKDIKSSLDYKI